MSVTRGIIAFDPGKAGGFAHLAPGDGPEAIVLRPWTVEHELSGLFASVKSCDL